MTPLASHTHNVARSSAVALCAVLLSSTVVYAQGVRGSIADKKTGEPLIEASVKVVSCAQVPCPAGQTVLTDVDGNFELPLPAGVYELRAFYELYQSRRIADVQVQADEWRTLKLDLSTDQEATEEVVVEARIDKKSSAAMLSERKRAPVAQDIIAAEQMAKSPDSNASEAVKRVVSATVKDGKYVFVRGLGGRYSVTLMNGAELPSPDPDEQAVPLDLFPTALLANLTINKTYSADVPGTFAGGVLLIESNAYPAKWDLRARIGTDYNSQTTFQRVNGYRGGGLDFLGFDDGTRKLPGAVPRDRPVLPGRVTNEEANQAGRAFSNTWALRQRTGLPALNLMVSAGDTLQLAGRRLGYLATVSYSSQDRAIDAVTRAVKLGPARETLVREELRNRAATQSTALSGLLNAVLELAPEHEVGAFVLYTHQADNLAQRVTGESESDGAGVDSTRFQFVERALWFNQLRGKHRLLEARNLDVDWQANFSLTSRDEPDTRDLTYNLRLGDGVPVFRDQPGSGQRFFSNLNDRAFGGSVNARWQLEYIAVKAGAWLTASNRRFDARRFRLQFDGSDPTAMTLPPETLFAGDRIGSDISFREETLASDAYDASLWVAAGYALVELSPLDWMKAQIGLRFEHAEQRMVPGSAFSISGAPPAGSQRIDNDPLPAVNVTLAASDDMNVRLAYSSTIARPRFRELAPFLWFDFSRRRSVSGNPALQATRIHNTDARWEWFFANDSILSASIFYKYFMKPIETSIVSVSDGAVSFANAKAAHLVGAEVEARTTLAPLAAVLSDFYIHANAAFVWSRVEIDPTQARALTSTQRALQGQSPVVANLTLGWTHQETGTEIAALYNVYGDRIAEVGYLGLPDVTEKALHRIDISASQQLPAGFRLKASALNLADQHIQLFAGPIAVQRYKPGVTVLLRLEWALQ